MLEGVAYMHSLNIMHRDLKPENILVSCHNAVKIADFGQACLYYPNDENREYEENFVASALNIGVIDSNTKISSYNTMIERLVCVATRWYRAPELLFGCRRYTPSVDVWALGCVLAEFFICSPLFSGRSDIEQISRVFALLGTPGKTTWPSWKEMPDAGKLVFEESAPVEDWRTIVRGASPQLLEFLLCHLCLESQQRWTADSLLRHNYISSTCCDNRIEKLRLSLHLLLSSITRRATQRIALLSLAHYAPMLWLRPLAVLVVALMRPAHTIECFCTDENCKPFGTCDGSVCLVGILRENNHVIRACGTRAVGCIRDEDEKWIDMCACDRPYCNSFTYLRSHSGQRRETGTPEDVPLVFQRVDRPDDGMPPPEVPIATTSSLLTILAPDE
uniref:Protein kinase domain-containing protein n=1 Tax=Heterorhabditis bacteriophora TaxID=37862 RepID=A0A1I7X9W5_HETBA